MFRRRSHHKLSGVVTLARKFVSSGVHLPAGAFSGPSDVARTTRCTRAGTPLCLPDHGSMPGRVDSSPSTPFRVHCGRCKQGEPGPDHGHDDHRCVDWRAFYDVAHYVNNARDGARKYGEKNDDEKGVFERFTQRQEEAA